MAMRKQVGQDKSEPLEVSESAALLLLCGCWINLGSFLYSLRDACLLIRNIGSNPLLLICIVDNGRLGIFKGCFH